MTESDGADGADGGARDPAGPRVEKTPGGREALVRALNVGRNARRGFAFGAVFAVAVFAFFVLIPGTAGSPVPFAALAFVLALAVGMLATALLTVVSAYRLSKEL